MKRTRNLFLILITIFFVACSDKGDNYELTGKLENCNECSVYLMEMENSGVKALDTIKVSKDGKFSVKEKLAEESIFILQGSNDYIMLCPKKNEKIRITADYENMAVTYTIEGSEESSKLKLLNDKQTMTRFALKNMNEQLQMQDINNIDSVRQEITKKYHLLRENQRQFLIDYINTYEGSLTTLVALYRNMENTPLIDPLRDEAIYEKVLKGLQKKLPNNKNTKYLEHLVSRINSTKYDKE
ncbi:MAG: DUF4369 domain-containing protein [Bacteroidales bacterium]